jgi:hypothetical protein
MARKWQGTADVRNDHVASFRQLNLPGIALEKLNTIGETICFREVPSKLHNLGQIDRVDSPGACSTRDQGKEARPATEVHDYITRPYGSLDRLHVRTYPDGIRDHGSVVTKGIHFSPCLVWISTETHSNVG